MHDILMITYKRATFTRMALERLLTTCDHEMRVWVWHNGGENETLAVVRSFASHPRFHRLYISPENVKLREPTNWFWNNSDGQYLSKVDDDCLLPDGWAQTLRSAHAAEPKFGAIGCWRFYDEDFLPEIAGKKIRTFAAGHRLMVHGFVQGSGHVLKRAMIEQLGPIRNDESFTAYCTRAACQGWINGWYYPFIHEDHMDDARSPNYPIKNEEEFRKNLSLSQINFGVNTLSDWRRFGRILARHLQHDVFDPAEHRGWKKWAGKIKQKFSPKKNFIQRYQHLLDTDRDRGRR